MAYYKLVKITFNTPGLAKNIINVVVHHYDFSNLIVTDRNSFFISKCWSLLCYFFGIKQKLSITFCPQIDSQTKSQNSTIYTYL